MSANFFASDKWRYYFANSTEYDYKYFIVLFKQQILDYVRAAIQSFWTKNLEFFPTHSSSCRFQLFYPRIVQHQMNSALVSNFFCTRTRWWSLSLPCLRVVLIVRLLRASLSSSICSPIFGSIRRVATSHGNSDDSDSQLIENWNKQERQVLHHRLWQEPRFCCSRLDRCRDMFMGSGLPVEYMWVSIAIYTDSRRRRLKRNSWL